MPREAASMGIIIITNNINDANKIYKDYNLTYKADNKQQLEIQIKEILDDYENKWKEQQMFRDKIAK